MVRRPHAGLRIIALPHYIDTGCVLKSRLEIGHMFILVFGAVNVVDPFVCCGPPRPHLSVLAGAMVL